MPDPLMTQVKNIVFLMLENRSLDNLLGWLYEKGKPEYVYPPGSSADYDGLAVGKFTQPLDGVEHEIVKRPDNLTPGYEGLVPYWDPNEAMYGVDSWHGVMNQMFSDGKETIGRMPTSIALPTMRGFLQDYRGTLNDWHDILWTFTPDQLPVINRLARHYAVSDAWHSSVPTQTNPNRAYSLIGTSKGMNNNSWK